MNILEFLKNGSGIHIKKKNRGKFRLYCGGEVTDECIRKAKASGNPTLVKRATFALNARHFKHRSGGKVKKHQGFVDGVNILDDNPNMYKHVKKNYKMRSALEGAKMDWGKILSNVGSSLLSTYILQPSSNADIAKSSAELEYNDLLAKQNYLNMLAAKLFIANNTNPENPNAFAGQIAFNSIMNMLSGAESASLNLNFKRKITLIDNLAKLEQNNNLTNTISSIMNLGMGLIANYYNNKKSSSNNDTV